MRGFYWVIMLLTASCTNAVSTKLGQNGSDLSTANINVDQTKLNETDANGKYKIEAVQISVDMLSDGTNYKRDFRKVEDADRTSGKLSLQISLSKGKDYKLSVLSFGQLGTNAKSIGTVFYKLKEPVNIVTEDLQDGVFKISAEIESVASGEENKDVVPETTPQTPPNSGQNLESLPSIKNISLKSESGATLKLQDVMGDKQYMFADISTSWCYYCKVALPNIERNATLHSTFNGNKCGMIVFDSIESDQNEFASWLDLTLKYPKTRSHSFAASVNALTSAFGKFGYPSIFILNRKGEKVVSDIDHNSIGSYVPPTDIMNACR